LLTTQGLFGSRIRRGRERRDFNGGEGREDILIKNVFVRKGMRGILKLFYCFTLKFN